MFDPTIDDGSATTTANSPLDRLPKSRKVIGHLKLAWRREPKPCREWASHS